MCIRDRHIGDLQAKFRVSAPESIIDGDYYITWETVGDDNLIYTPLQKTKVTVTKLQNIVIDIGDVFEIPYGGNSLPIIFHTDYAPNLGIEIIVTFEENYPGLSLSSKNVILTAGQNNNSFTIISSNTTSGSEQIERGTVNLLISGINKNVYALPQQKIDFLIIAADTEAPTVTECLETSTTQTTAQVKVAASEISEAYVFVALSGTSVPSFQEVYNSGTAPYESTRSQYYSTIIGSSGTDTISVYGLEAGIQYVIYCFARDRWYNIGDVKQREFTTLSRYQAADLKMQFTQTYLNSAEKQNIIDDVAFVLSIDPSKMQVKQYYFSTSARIIRALATSVEETSITLDLQIIAIPTTENYPTPYKLALSLNNKKDTLNELLTNFDTDYTITVSEFVSYTPSFVSIPEVSDQSTNYVKFTIQLDNYGVSYAVALIAGQDTKPSPAQIKWGFNASNVPAPWNYVNISEKYTLFYITIEDLEPDTQYSVYVIGGSAHPGYPDLMAKDDIIQLNIKTDAEIIVPHLNIQEALRIGQVGVIVLLMVILIVGI
eukprot:TRINITY_DN9178_c0_g1_i1.p1 TRINITY_DN9178_c0_g1~~TRINITY_DN9178_c0_g1_i1.p1  ORF type:complete len:546 (+),score=71.98 TRINITY_DN9178_c0_g1_i1:127-1764(+)